MMLRFGIKKCLEISFKGQKRVEARLRGIQTRIAKGPNEYLLNLECHL